MSYSFFACSSPTERRTVRVDEPAKRTVKLPSFAIEDSDGNIADLSSFKGRNICESLGKLVCPCRAEMPSFEMLARILDNDQTVFIMLSLDNNFEVIKKFAIRQKRPCQFIIPLKIYRLNLGKKQFLLLSYLMKTVIS